MYVYVPVHVCVCVEWRVKQVGTHQVHIHHSCTTNGHTCQFYQWQLRVITVINHNRLTTPQTQEGIQ